MTDSLRDALEQVLASTDGWAVSNETLLDLLRAHPAEPVGVSDEAVVAGRIAFYEHPASHGMNSKAQDRAIRAALEAAQPFMQPQVVASLPTQRQLDGWLSDHEKVYHGELGDRCACGWRPDSWESEDEFDEYFRDHRSAAVLALMGGAE